jgi:hypothetical protein
MVMEVFCGFIQFSNYFGPEFQLTAGVKASPKGFAFAEVVVAASAERTGANSANANAINMAHATKRRFNDCQVFIKISFR